MNPLPDDPRATSPSGIVRPAFACGFGVAVGLWCLWFITHLPWLGLSESVSVPILLAYWCVAAVICGRAAVGLQGWKVGVLSGVITATVGIIILGSKLTSPSAADADAVSLRPDAWQIAGGFIVLGAAIGLAGGVIGGMLRGGHESRRKAGGLVAPNTAEIWTFRFSLVTASAIAPLLVVGGLVTSTNSGMAVVDWPNTFGTNMILYPIGPRVPAPIFLEHAHRLFGMLGGLSMFVLMCMTLAGGYPRWTKNWSIGVFVLVAAQGVLGGLRVRLGDTFDPSHNRWIAVIHGVLAQVIFSGIIALCVYLSHAYRQPPDRPQGARRLRGLATGAWHSTILQLFFGALYRHLRSPHALWMHAGFSFIVLVMAVLAGFSAGVMPRDTVYGRAIRRAALFVRIAVGVQFVLGWVAFIAGGRALGAENVTQALIRTAHQANGAFLLAAATWLAVLARRIPKK